MNSIRVIGFALLALILTCFASFLFQNGKINEMTRLSVAKTNAVKRNVILKTRSLFSSYRLDELEMLKPLAQPRPLFKFKVFPNVRRRLPEYLVKHDIRWTMITAIKSSYKRFEQRQAIRKSWGGIRYLNGVRMHVVFVLALPVTPEEEEILKRENAEFGDILQVELNETYRGIGFKALAAMQWVGDAFPDNWLYFSGDDDMLPDLERLHQNIQSMIDERNITGHFENSLPIHCAFHQAQTPHVHRVGKWIVTREEYPHNFYPPICLGGFYGLSVKLSKAIYNASRYYPYFRHDDVFITGFMRLVACDSADDLFNFERTDKFCALSTIQNSNFQHIHVQPELYKLRWIAVEEEMRSSGVELVRNPGNGNATTSNLPPQIAIQTQRDEALKL